MALKLIE